MHRVLAHMHIDMLKLHAGRRFLKYLPPDVLDASGVSKDAHVYT